jgi:hypothetical protein
MSAGPSVAPRLPARRASPVSTLAPLALVLLASCSASTHHGTLLADSSGHARSSSPAASSPRARTNPDPLGPIRSSHVDLDYFQGLLVRGGTPPSALPKDGRALTPEDAARLLSWLLAAEVPLRDFGPWRMAAHLLWEVIRGGAPVARSELHARMRRFHSLLVLRTDGFLVRATTGRAVQQVGDVALLEGALRAEGFQVGPFYLPRGKFLYPVDDSLEIHPDAVLAGVYSPEEGTFGPAVEGVGLAVVDSISGLVNLVLHPGETLEGLAKLPTAVRVLLENSPQYWERFRASSHGAQVRSVSRILTHVLITCGTAGAGASRAASMGGKLGSLGVPVPPGGPGKWVQKAEGMSEDAMRYQVQVTGAPQGWVYRVFFGPGPDDYVDFDGFVNGVLLEAKGPNLAKFIDEGLEPVGFFKGADGMLRQARRQSDAANGLPIRWIVAEKKFADFLRELFRKRGLSNIEVVHVPAKPTP